MYDHISLKLKHTFTPAEWQTFCIAYGLVETKKGIYDNYAVKGLVQYRGLRFFYDSANLVLKLDFSLHKFWNLYNGRGSVNYNLFTLSDAFNAYLYLLSLLSSLGINIVAASVQAYEYGLNIPIHYFSDAAGLLEQAHNGYIYNGREARELIKDRRQLGLVGTAVTKHVRTIYLLYDKRKEVQSKQEIDIGQMLRVEVKHKRSNLAFQDLFTDRKKCAKDLEQSLLNSFVDGLYFRPFGLTYSERVARLVMLRGSSALAWERVQLDHYNRLINDVQLRQFKAAFDKHQTHYLPQLTNDERTFRSLVLAVLMSALV